MTSEAPPEDWGNPWYATWRFSRLPKPAKAAIMAFIREMEKGGSDDQ